MRLCVQFGPEFEAANMEDDLSRANWTSSVSYGIQDTASS